MSFLLHRTCTLALFYGRTSTNVTRCTIILPPLFASSLLHKYFPSQKTICSKKPSFSTCSAKSRPKAVFSRFVWDVSLPKPDMNLIENFQRNVSTSSHVHCQKNPENFGEMKENKIFTVPNMLCFGRILASPVLGYFVLLENYIAAVCLFVVAGFTDMLDGFIARRFPSQMSYLGSILDPIADKILVGVLTVSLSIAHLVPVPLAVVILGRDVALILGSFVVRFISLPQPRTFTRYFNFNLPTVQVTPSVIGKVNTALQLALISISLAAPIFDINGHSGLLALQWTVGITTVASGLDYFITRRGFSILGGKYTM